MSTIQKWDHMLMIGDNIAMCGKKEEVKIYYDKALAVFMNNKPSLIPMMFKVAKEPTKTQTDKAWFNYRKENNKQALVKVKPEILAKLKKHCNETVADMANGYFNQIKTK